VNVPQDKLDELADKVFRVNSHLLRAEDRLRRDPDAADALALIEQGRRVNHSVLTGLVSAGAQDPLKKALAEDRRERLERGLPTAPVREVPLHLLSSPAARRYAEAIRAAATACREMETERYGPDCDGLAETLEDYADVAELEVFGPVGLRGME